MKFCGKCNRSYGGTQVVCLVDGERLTYKDLYGFVGQLIAGKYMVHELSNIGGMSAVYLAQQIGVDRRVAFKILLPNVAASNANLARLFEREAKTAGKLSHENIATIYDAGHTPEGVPYIVMEWLDGHTLEKEIEDGQPLSLERITYLLRQIAGALDAAHARHVIHRDLKPGNIMLVRRPDGRDQVKVVDFGLAKVGSQAGEMQVSEAVGTPNYASPEQFQTGSDIDSRTDIYSLGIMIYQLLTGHLPFQVNTIAEAVRAHLLETPKPVTFYRPELPPAIENIINRMLAKTPQYRPDSANEVASVFEWVLADLHGDSVPSVLPRPHTRVLAAGAEQPASINALDDVESYSLEDLFRPVNDSPKQSQAKVPPISPSLGAEQVTPQAYDSKSFNMRVSADMANPALNFKSGKVFEEEVRHSGRIIEEQVPTAAEPLGKSQGKVNASGSQQTRVTNISGSRNKQPIAVVNPAIGEGLTLPLLGLPLPGSRRQQMLAITAILLSIGLCLAFLFLHKEPQTTQLGAQDTLILAELTNRTGQPELDGTLQPAALSQLAQSPFLSVLPAERVRAGLETLGQKPGAPLNRELARELGQRLKLSTIVSGEISAKSGSYDIQLRAHNVQSNQLLTESQARANNKNEIIAALSQAVLELRKKLGDTTVSNAKFNLGAEKGLTNSLSALQAYAQGLFAGERLNNPAKAAEAFEKAIVADPEFAMAHFGLAQSLWQQNAVEPALAAAQKALQLSARANEHDRLVLQGFTQTLLGDWENAQAAYLQLVQVFPRDLSARLQAAELALRLGKFESANTLAQEIIKQTPENGAAYQIAAAALIRSERVAEAERLLNSAADRKASGANWREQLFQIGLMRDDTALQQTQVTVLKNSPEAFNAQAWQAAAAAYRGQYRSAQTFAQQARNTAQANQVPDEAIAIAMNEALRAALLGDATYAQSVVLSAWQQARGSFLKLSDNSPAVFGPLVLALAGAVNEAQTSSDEFARLNPQNTPANTIWLPLTRAALALQAQQPNQALALLKDIRDNEPTAFYFPAWLRGQAHLALKQPTEAAAAFETILQHRGYDPTSVIYPLTHLQLARAYAQANQATQSRKAYTDFLTIWKDADNDLPYAQAAKTELAALK